MKTRYKALILILIAAGSFLAGSWFAHRGSGGKAAAERRVLHYVDPMNPAFKSDKPGIAPCGMPLEPVYADEGGAVPGGADLRTSLPPGTVRISPEKQQLIGVKTTMAEKIPWSHTLRVLGRVTPDETRTYRINAAISGWIEDALPVTTGSLVKQNELLATFYSLEYRNLVQNYFNLINITKEGAPGEKALTQTSRYSTGQLKLLRDAAKASTVGIDEASASAQMEYYRRNLYNYGMSPYQVEEMERTRRMPDVVEIRAPIGGFILYRNVSNGLRFDRGTEFFRIADLSRVWILADIFETEASFFKPGMRVRMELPYQKRSLHAEVSTVLPQFDPATRTLKVRLEADNPGYVMRPDMFVNVELPVNGPPAIIVPVDAVLDSGLKKTVFVDKGGGVFEPRQVETGRMLGERVEIARGLASGERIVVSGNFLIDSEARMQQAASGIVGKIGRDPVCGMNVDEDRAQAEGNVGKYKGQGYFFCSPACRDDFAKDPVQYLKSPPAHRTMPVAGSPDAATKHPSSHDPAPVQKPRAAKAVHEAHDGMMPPAAQRPGAMPHMAVDPKGDSKTGRMAIPSAAALGMTPQSPSFQGPGRMTSMPQGAAPMPGPPVGGMTPPSAAPGTIPRSPAVPGPAGAEPMPESKAGEPSSPPAAGPGMSRQAPSFPGPGNMQMPEGKPGERFAPMTGGPGTGTVAPAFPGQKGEPPPSPQEAAAVPRIEGGKVVQGPEAGTPRIAPRSQRYRLPGTAPQAGTRETAPVPGPKAGEMLPREAGNPEVKP